MLRDRDVAVITQPNLGSAGGWHRAIAYCQENQFDAIWLMDDDGFPAPDALQHLELALQPSFACVSSVVLKDDHVTQFVFPFPVLDHSGLPVIFGIPRKLYTLQDLKPFSLHGTYPFVHLFNGSLISSQAINHIGNINRDFFIFGEEVDFFFRLRQAGPVVSLLKARHFHPDVSSRPYSPVKIYYYIRNTFVLNDLYFNLPRLRNCLVLLVVLFRIFRRNGFLQFLSYIFGRRFPLLLRATLAGLNHELDRNCYG